MARTETHFIWVGDYAGRLAQLQAAADAAKDDATPLLGGEEHPYDVLARDYATLLEEAEAAGLRIVVRGLRDDEWDDLVDAHPPRTDEQFADGDKTLGFNERTGLRPLILAGLVEPAIDTRSRFDDWIAEHGLSRGDIKAVAFKVWALTNGVNAVDPKSLPPLPIRDVEQT